VSAAAPPPEKDLIGRVVDRVMELPPVRWLKPILDDYDAAGGGLLASGLAFNSLFAILPAILLLVGVLGLILNDPARLDALVRQFTERFPPLEEFFRQALSQFGAGAMSFSLLGLVGLIWGSSRFYQSLDDAIARIFRGSRRRDPFQRGIRGVLSVVLLFSAVLLAVFLGGFLDGIQTHVAALNEAIRLLTSTLGSGLGTIAIFALAIALIYRMVPTDTPAWSAIGRPALAVGLALAVFTLIYAVITPRLVGSLEVYGAFVAVFAAMIWLSYVAQAILVGAAWVYRRTQEMAARTAG
jgi:membrane protein